jgi:hypothetical protein
MKHRINITFLRSELLSSDYFMEMFTYNAIPFNPDIRHL